MRPGCGELRVESDGTRAVLLLHGFGDTPQTFCYLAPELSTAGFAIHAPLLPGHGTTTREFDESTATEWHEAAVNGFGALARRYPSVSVVGLSMGGALGVLLAAGDAPVRSLVLIAPYLRMPRLMTVPVAAHGLWSRILGPFDCTSPRTIRDPEERRRNLAYPDATGRVLNELRGLARDAWGALPDVKVPTLVIQSREDNRVSAVVSAAATTALGAREKRLMLTSGAGHVLTVDYGREDVIAGVRDWLVAHSGPAAKSES